MTAFDTYFATKIWLSNGKFLRLELFFKNAASQTFSCNGASQQNL